MMVLLAIYGTKQHLLLHQLSGHPEKVPWEQQ
jgi:hypothetical protein